MPSFNATLESTMTGDPVRLRNAIRPMGLLFSTALILAMCASAQATELTIGLIPERNVFEQVKRYKPIGDYIEKKTGLRVHFTLLRRYGNIIDSFLSTLARKFDDVFSAPVMQPGGGLARHHRAWRAGGVDRGG
jgi:hypothetical protein